MSKTQQNPQPVSDGLSDPSSGERETKRLGDIAHIKTGSRNNQDKVENGEYPFFVRSATVERINSYSFEGEAILVPGEGDIGNIFHYIIGRFDVHQRVYKISNFRADVCGKFVYYSMVRHFGSHAIQNTVKATVDSLRLPTFKNFTFPLPRGVEKQESVAEALSDVDRLLRALETLIAKKRATKQAAMQQLLTGKTRLPGFSGEWATRRIGDLLAYERPDHYIVQSTEYLERGDVPVLTANKSFVLGYTDEDFGICHYLPAIVFDDFTTDCKYAMFPFKVKSSAIKLLRAKHERVSLRYVFERTQLVRFPVGDHKRYYISEYQDIALLVPDYDEQVEIVSALADMDAEVAALERRRKKTRAIKQGMMQQLLTGRVRLVKVE